MRRAARPVQLIDGAERFPDLYGHDGPVWIGPEEVDASAPSQRERAPEPFPDPLADFEAELTSARAESGIVDEPAIDLGVVDEEALDALPDERNGEFAPEDEDALEVYDPSIDADFALDDVADDDHDDDLGAPQRPAGPVGPQALTPMGRYRAEVTESPEFEWRIPPRRVLTRSGKESPGASRIDQQQTSALLLEALGTSA